MTRRIFAVVYDGFEILDMAGPLGVFGNANAMAATPAYALSTVSSAGGPVQSSVGIVVETAALPDVAGRDTVLIVGAEAESLRQAARDAQLRAWLQRAAGAGARMASVCTGAFLLAGAGLLAGARATTHWAARADLARRYPSAIVADDALYVEDGNFWSSAGIATGIDMALAMIERDLGAGVMHDVARRMVIYAHRPGKQSQFSRLLAAQRRAPGVLSDLLAHIDANVAGDLSLGRLAAVGAMSERTLHRRFVKITGQTPGRYVESVRMERASQFLEDGRPIKEVAQRVGYRTEQGFRAAFEAHHAMPPSLHKRLHGKRKAPSPDHPGANAHQPEIATITSCETSRAHRHSHGTGD